MKASKSTLRKQLELSRGLKAIIDADDYKRASFYKWHAVPYSGGEGFKAARVVKTKNGLRKAYLHHLILGTTEMIDHINHDALDNRKANLRVCTASQNQANRRMTKNNRSGFKGVTRNKKKWQARIKQKSLGTFSTREEAALAYNVAAVE